MSSRGENPSSPAADDEQVAAKRRRIQAPQRTDSLRALPAAEFKSAADTTGAVWAAWRKRYEREAWVGRILDHVVECGRFSTLLSAATATVTFSSKP
jgi:hypothetical protein